MSELLRVGKSSVHFYCSGGFCCDLNGTNFSVDVTDNVIALSIDLTNNLKVRSRGANCRLDVSQFIEQTSSLRFIQIDEEGIVEGLRRKSDQVSNAQFFLKLVIEQDQFDYKVLPEMRGNSLFLVVGH